MRYAVVFSTFYWDDFVARQYERIRARVRPGDLYVTVDETAGPQPPVPVRKTLPIGAADFARLIGTVPRVTGIVGQDSLIWWNLDVLSYRLFEAEPDYDYCLTLDYDALVNLDLDRFLDAVHRDGADFVAGQMTGLRWWSWRRMHGPLYPLAKLRAALVAVAVVSKPASAHLLSRRRSMSTQHERGELPVWPFCEAFMATELAEAGYRLADLSAYGDASLYRWRPVHLEQHIAAAMPPGFIHPVRPRADKSSEYKRVT